MILRLCFILIILNSITEAADIPGFNRHENSVCGRSIFVGTPDETLEQPDYYAKMFVAPVQGKTAPERCAEWCKNTKTCSGFAFSALYKHSCHFYIFSSQHTAVVINMGRVLRWPTGNGEFHVNNGVPCVENPNRLQCGLDDQWQCYVYITQAPSRSPTREPTKSPATSVPSRSPTQFPLTSKPTTAPTNEPTTSKPSVSPTNDPTKEPTVSAPTRSPSKEPTVSTPTRSPTKVPTSSKPTLSPSKNPTFSAPTKNPSQHPLTSSPTKSPSKHPTTSIPTADPTKQPVTSLPSKHPSTSPIGQPTESPTTQPSRTPSKAPIGSPSKSPTIAPSKSPTKFPSRSPTKFPSKHPSKHPSKMPTSSIPTLTPSKEPTTSTPTSNPSKSPTVSPSKHPSKYPSKHPSKNPSRSPTKMPTTSKPTNDPSKYPTSSIPTENPTQCPTTSIPTKNPSASPSRCPTTSIPTISPSKMPTTSIPTNDPTKEPTTSLPTKTPSKHPSNNPSKSPTVSPSKHPSVSPSHNPSTSPSETNPCSIPNDQLLGSKYVDLKKAESSFINDVLVLVLTVPQKYKIESITFTDSTTDTGKYAGADTNHWTMNFKPNEPCMQRPTFRAGWKQIRDNGLAGFKVTEENNQFYLMNRINLNLIEEVTTDNHAYTYDRKVFYEIPYAIKLDKEVELSVSMTMVVPTFAPSLTPSRHPTGSPSRTPSAEPTTSTPSNSPTLHPSNVPTKHPSNHPSRTPSKGPTPLTMDHLFTEFSLLKPNPNGNSKVDIDFTTIVRLPWRVIPGEHQITDDNDLINDGSDKVTMLEDCFSKFKYTKFDGLCVDSQRRFPPSMFAEIPKGNENLCRDLCDQQLDCEGFDVTADKTYCELIGTKITKEWETLLASSLNGGFWTFIPGDGGKPTAGFGPAGQQCFIKQQQAWQTNSCEVAPQQAPLPEDCFCTQKWNMVYESSNVCDVSGWWDITFKLKSIAEPHRRLYYHQSVFVGLKSACAKVIGTNEVCQDDSCSLQVWDSKARTNNPGKFFTGDSVFAVGRVTSNFPIKNLDVLSLKFSQVDGTTGSVDVSNIVKEKTLNGKVTGGAIRYWAAVHFNFPIRTPPFGGSVSGTTTTLTATTKITYSDGSSTRRLLSMYIPQDHEPLVDVSASIFVYERTCTDPPGQLGHYHIKRCGSAKTIFVCDKTNVWKQIGRDGCAGQQHKVTSLEQSDKLPEDLTEEELENINNVVYTNTDNNNNTLNFWRTSAIVSLGVVILGIAVCWCLMRFKEEEKQINEQLEWNLEGRNIRENTSQTQLSQVYAEVFAQNGYLTEGQQSGHQSEI